MTLLGVALILASLYLLVCAIDPYGTCLACNGYGTRRVRVWRTCRHCGGSGERLRLGARLWRHR